MKYKDYKGNGVLINLDIEYIPYTKLIFEPEKFLNKRTKYYFYCKGGTKSKEVVMSLSLIGYDVTQLVN